MDRIIPVAYILFLLIELIYLVSCIVTIVRVIKYRRSTAEHRVLTAGTLVFLYSCFVGSIFHNIQSKVGSLAHPFFVLFLLIEISYLILLVQTVFAKKNMKLAFSILLLVSVFIIPYLASKQLNRISYDPLFAYESLIAASISFAYFQQLGDNNEIKNLIEDPITLIMLGLFFCYSLPFIYNSVMTAINYMDSSFYTKIIGSKYDGFILACISRVGTLCYLIFNLFIYKAFKCRTQMTAGI